MNSPSTTTTSTRHSCFHDCCLSPFLTKNSTTATLTSPINTAAISRYDFESSIHSSLTPNAKFTNHESLPSLLESLSNFIKLVPDFSQTNELDRIRETEYSNLANHVCFDYAGHGLFSYSQVSDVASTSRQDFLSFHSPRAFNVCYKTVSLSSEVKFGGSQGTEVENVIRSQIMRFMSLSEDEYSLIFTANQSSAFKLLAESYPFQSNRNLLTVYDHETESMKGMNKIARRKGGKVRSAEFSWPDMNILSGKLRKRVVNGSRNKKGLFVFPLQSRVTGAKYSYLWMRMAQENGWHLLLDACALGPKSMETLGLSLFKPDFVICSFYKVFGEDPSGFGCLFVKKSSASVLQDSSPATNLGIVKLVPSSLDSELCDHTNVPEIEELVPQFGSNELECRGLDQVDSTGLILISSRKRYLINWLVNALTSLEHPNSQNGMALIKIYGPKIKFTRGPAIAFNVFDWKGEKIDPVLVQKLADRSNISLGYGILENLCFSDKFPEEEKIVKRDDFRCGISVVTAAISFLTNFEDVYRLWKFVSKFLDADFVDKERWRYTALNQEIVEI